MKQEKLEKKAKWIIAEKLKISDSDKISEVEMEIFPDRFMIKVNLKNNNIRKAVLPGKELADMVLFEISKMITKGKV